MKKTNHKKVKALTLAQLKKAKGGARVDSCTMETSNKLGLKLSPIQEDRLQKN